MSALNKTRSLFNLKAGKGKANESSEALIQDMPQAGTSAAAAQSSGPSLLRKARSFIGKDKQPAIAPEPMPTGLPKDRSAYAQLPAGTSAAPTPLAQAEASASGSGSLPKSRSLLNLRVFGKGNEPPPVPALPMPDRLEPSTMLKGRGTRDRTPSAPPPSPTSETPSLPTGPKVKFHPDADAYKALKSEFNPAKVNAKFAHEDLSILTNNATKDHSRKPAKVHVHTPSDQELWKTPGKTGRAAVGPREAVMEKRERAPIVDRADRRFSRFPSELQGMVAKGGNVEKHGKSSYPKKEQAAIAPASSNKTSSAGASGSTTKVKIKDQGGPSRS